MRAVSWAANDDDLRKVWLRSLGCLAFGWGGISRGPVTEESIGRRQPAIEEDHLDPATKSSSPNPLFDIEWMEGPPVGCKVAHSGDLA